MDDLSFWVYIIFAVVMFIIRGIKKRNESDSSTSQPANRPAQPQKKPVSFEDLLREFTEGREAEEATPEPEPRQKPVEARQLVKERRWQEENKPKTYEEGKTRRFSDEDSKKVYEDSIKRAEENKLDFERADNFKSKMKRREEEQEEHSAAEEIKNMLQDQDQAKKAIILSEILNRKY